MTEEKKSVSGLSELNKETPDKPKLDASVTTQKIQGSSEENRMLRAIGEKLCPDGYKYLGSFSCHLYKPIFGMGVQSRIQNCIDDATMTEANWAVQETAIVVAKSYGWEPGKKRRKQEKREL